jgi:p-cumate 2,3-dioxygenase alpha subunit
MEIVPGAHEYAANANWKLYVENSLDGYHVLPLHITYFEYLEQTADPRRYQRGGRPRQRARGDQVARTVGAAGGPLDASPWGAEPRAGRGRVCRTGPPERADLLGRVDRIVMIFPNLIILDLMGVVVRKITPTSAGHTRITHWTLATAGEGADLRARRLENFITFQGPGGFATPDDVEAFEACQTGFRTGAGVPWSDISRGMHREHSGSPAATPTSCRCASSGDSGRSW